MLKLAAASGTTDIVASPHASPQYKYDGELVDSRIKELSSLPQVPRIHRGCDFHLSFENIPEALLDPAKFTINGKKYLLVEFADAFIPPSTEEILRRFLAIGVIPVVTHPERNPILQGSTDRLRQWSQMGCLMQVTAQSLTDRFGKAAQNSAWSLLRAGLVHVIASDGHDAEHRPPRLDYAREILIGEMGLDAASLLLVHNPGGIIAGEKIWMQAPAALPPKRKKWFFF